MQSSQSNRKRSYGRFEEGQPLQPERQDSADSDQYREQVNRQMQQAVAERTLSDFAS